MSKREKYQHFFYLLLLLMGSITAVSVIFLRNYASPFSSQASYEIQMLDQKNQFADLQNVIYPFIQKTYGKIDALPMKDLSPYQEADIKNNINQIANALNDERVFDPRKEAFLQIAQYYRMYFDDKRIAGKKADNILLFEKEFTECSIGFKEKEQQLAQKNAAVLARNN